MKFRYFAILNAGDIVFVSSSDKVLQHMLIASEVEVRVAVGIMFVCRWELKFRLPTENLRFFNGGAQSHLYKEFGQLGLNTTSQLLLVGLGHMIFMAAILTL